jgi:hypothetical protein
VKKWLKKIHAKVMNYDLDTLIAIKSSFQSNKFQWIKTNDRSKLGIVVEVRDVIPARNGRFFALLSDGSQIDTDRVSSDFMMLQDDQPPLSMMEVESLNYVPGLEEGVKVSPDIPLEVANAFETITPPSKPAAETNQEIRLFQPKQQSQQIPQVQATDLFGMFELEETDLTLVIKVKLPSKTLLKMMYTNSKDKPDFLTRLSAYINNNVTPESIKSTLQTMLSGSKKKKADELELQ